jgi:hypothetical protein
MSWDGVWFWWVSNRQDIVPLATLLGGLVGLCLLYIRTSAADRTAKTAADRHAEQTQADRERRITESFAKAIEQLGNGKLEIRLGGIYTLAW